MLVFFIYLFFFSFCTNKSYLKIKIPANSCHPNNQIIKFEKVTDLPSCLRNQKRANIYFYKQKEEFSNTVKCYEAIINEINK